MTINCSQCSKPFDAPPSAVRRGTRFCSRDCYTANTARVDRVCIQCGTAFKAKPSRADQQCCGHDCMYAHRTATGWRGFKGAKEGWKNPRKLPRVDRVCEWCNSPFEIMRHYLRKPNTGRFCSLACSGSWTIRNCQNRVSKGDVALTSLLEARGFVFEKQAQFGSFVIDVIFRTERVAVELDGDYWHSLPRVVEKDSRKDVALWCAGYTVLHIPYTQFRRRPGDVVSRIESALARSAEVAA